MRHPFPWAKRVPICASLRACAALLEARRETPPSRMHERRESERRVVCCCCCCFGGEGCQRTPPFSCFNVTCGCRRMREWHLRSVFRAEREGRRLVLREDTCVCLPHDNVGLQSCSGLCACAWRKESGRLGMDDRFTWRERERDVAAWCVCMDEDETDRPLRQRTIQHSRWWCVCTLLQGDETGGLDGRCLTREAYVHVHRS